jgi:hypothetical protein
MRFENSKPASYSSVCRIATHSRGVSIPTGISIAARVSGKTKTPSSQTQTGDPGFILAWQRQAPLEVTPRGSRRLKVRLSVWSRSRPGKFHVRRDDPLRTCILPASEFTTHVLHRGFRVLSMRYSGSRALSLSRRPLSNVWLRCNRRNVTTWLADSDIRRSDVSSLSLGLPLYPARAQA